MNITNIEAATLRLLQIEARDKGLLVVSGKKGGCWHDGIWNKSPITYADDEIGYAVIKRYGGIDFSVDLDGKLYYEVYYDGPFEYWTVWFHYTLDEVKHIVEDYKFDKYDPSIPKFYGFIRIYEGENQRIYYEIQRSILEEWAEKEDIEFMEIFACRGGRPDYETQSEESAVAMEYDYPEAYDNALFSCKESLKKLREQDVLCVTESNRLDGDYELWKNRFIIKQVASPIKYKMYDYKICPPELPTKEEDDLPF